MQQSKAKTTVQGKKQSGNAFNLYGLRETNNKNYYSLSLCKSNGGTREWINTPVKADKVVIKGETAFIKVKFLVNDEKPKENESDDLPF